MTTRSVLLAACLLGACTDATESPPTRTNRVAGLDTVVATAEGDIAFAIDLEVSESGLLFAADLMASTVVAVDSSGAAAVLGRRGSGPGEFSGPFAIRTTSDGVLVLDRGNGRVQLLTEGGEFVRSWSAAPEVARTRPYLLSNGHALVSTGGTDEALVAEFDSAGMRLRTIGSPVVPVSTTVRTGSILEVIEDGRVPDQLRNEGLVAGNATGDVWIALVAEAEVRRYDRSGSLAWSTSVSEPEMDATLERFFSSNAASEDDGSFYPLRYFVDLELVGENLWVLLEGVPDELGVILVFDAEGRVARRIEIEGAGGANALAVDQTETEVFMFTRHDAQIVRASVR